MDVSALQMLVMVLTSWLERRDREALAYLIEENRLLRRQLGGRRPRLTDADWRQLAVRAFQVGRLALSEIATIVTPDALLRWHRVSVEIAPRSASCRLTRKCAVLKGRA